MPQVRTARMSRPGLTGPTGSMPSGRSWSRGGMETYIPKGPGGSKHKKMIENDLPKIEVSSFEHLFFHDNWKVFCRVMK